jgi:hypothetical protein
MPLCLATRPVHSAWAPGVGGWGVRAVKGADAAVVYLLPWCTLSPSVTHCRLLVRHCSSGPSLAAAAQQDLKLLAKVLVQGMLQGLSPQEQADLQQQYRQQGLDLLQLLQQAHQEQPQGRQVCGRQAGAGFTCSAAARAQILIALQPIAATAAQLLHLHPHRNLCHTCSWHILHH